MKYLLMIAIDEQRLDAMPQGEVDALVREHFALDDELRSRGQLVAGEALESVRSATTVRVSGGKATIIDGPFVCGTLPRPLTLSPPRRRGPNCRRILRCLNATSRQAVETVYRNESRRVLATLIRLLGDFDIAEEALHDAFMAALEQWPHEGVPSNPRAWLVSTGRFKAIDRIRRRAKFDVSLEDVAERMDETAEPRLVGRVKEVRALAPLVIAGQEYWCMDRLAANAITEGAKG